MSQRAQERKIYFAAIFTDITRRGSEPKEAFIYTAKKTTFKVVLKGIDKRIDFQSPMQSIE